MSDSTDAVTLPAAAQALQKGKSMQDIASMLADNTMKMRGAEIATPNEVNEDDDGAPETTDLDTGDSGNDEHIADADDVGIAADDVDALGEDDDHSGNEEETGGTVDEDDPNAEPQQADNLDVEEFEVSDDDLVELSDELQVSIGDLKKVYQADENLAARVQEQEVATNEALTMRAKAQHDTEQATGAINAMFKHILDIAAQPLISAPDEALKATDPARYIQHLEAFNNDKQRITETQDMLTNALGEYTTQTKQLKENRKQQEIQILATKIPAMQKAETRPQASKDILDAATHYGFKPEEVNDAIDHRIYLMAYDAQQYRKLMSQTNKEEVDLTEEKARTKVRQTRRLRSRGTNAKSRLSGQAKRLRVLKTKAQSSGKPADVAAYMAAKQSK